jgi:SAM-dependent methyltransferase
VSELTTLFEAIYKDQGWGNNNTTFFSGIGSHDSYLISPYIGVVKSFFKELKYKPNITDIGCGDFNIGKKLISYTGKYLALDVVTSLIEYNKNKYQNLNVNFKTLDITKESISLTDIIILKNVLQHLSNSQILAALKNIYLKSKYLIITESIPLFNFTPNLDMSPSATIRPLFNNSGIDILSSPFNFPIEEEVLTLTIKEKGIVECLTKTSIYKTKYE